MNIAGVMMCANLTYGDFNWESVRRVVDESELPYDLLPSESEAADFSNFISQVPVMSVAEMLETRRVGLLTIDEESYVRSTDHLRLVDVLERDADVWLEAFPLPGGYRLISPQVLAEVAGVYLIGPVAEGPGVTRLVTLDTGIRPRGGQEPVSFVLGRCEPGVDINTGKRICLQGSCTGRCEPDGWTTGRGPVKLTGCNCL
jgi:hypothetical protein